MVNRDTMGMAFALVLAFHLSYGMARHESDRCRLGNMPGVFGVRQQMKLALGMMVHNDNDWLRFHLPVYARCFDGIVMVVETREECQSLVTLMPDVIPGYPEFVYIIVRQFHNNWSEMFNH